MKRERGGDECALIKIRARTMTAAAALAETEVRSCVRGYHVYKDVWAASIGETLVCSREPTNNSDRYAVAVTKNGTVIGHLPRKMSRMCSVFIRRGGSIACTVTGARRYSSDLPQGGLEIPCTLLFSAKKKEIQKLKKILKDYCELHYIGRIDCVYCC